MIYFATKTPDELTERFPGLTIIGIQFMSEILPSLRFGIFNRTCSGIFRRLATPMSCFFANIRHTKSFMSAYVSSI